MFKNDRIIWQRERQRDYRIAELIRQKLSQADTATITRTELDQIYANHGMEYKPDETR